MSAPYPVFIGRGASEVVLQPAMANRHGLIAGATGTGKTVTLRVLAEQFSRMGVPVFLADVKGDLSGLAYPGVQSPKLDERVKQLGLPSFYFDCCPVVLWDVLGEQGHPLRTTVSEMGPLLLGRLLGLNDTQAGVLSMTFRIADDQQLLLLDLKDLRAMLEHVAQNAKEFRTSYGNVSAASVGAIQRALLTLEEQGGDRFFGEPALALKDLFHVAPNGRGVVNLLCADKLVQSPTLYSTFLLWLLAELFETLPEVGDIDKPKLVFFFDEAHLLFDDASKALRERIEQVVRLIRSKGIGIYFITQSPLDIPDTVLGQLGNRVQHALRAFTPKDKKAVKTVAETFRENPELDVTTAITELGVGEALASTLDLQGVPSPVERVWIYPPTSRLTPLGPEERRAVVLHSPLYGRYDTPVDRESAYEQLRARAAAVSAAKPNKRAEHVPAPGSPYAPAPPARAKREEPSAFGTLANSAARSAGNSLGREIMRGIFGSLIGSPSKPAKTAKRRRR